MTRYVPPDYTASADQARFRGSPLEELGGSSCRGDALLALVEVDEVMERAAGLTVCARALSGGWDRAEVRRLLDMLGIRGGS